MINMSKIVAFKKKTTNLAVAGTSFEKKMMSIKNNQNRNVQEIDRLALSFNQAMGRTAAAYLELSKLAYDASIRFKVDKWAYDYFCDKIGLSKSYLRKLSQIGSKADDLVEHINFLPNSMNSLYELSQLNDKDFKSVIQRKDDLKVLTSSDISKLNQKKVKKISRIELEDSPRKSKTKFINEFAKNLLLEFQYQIETIEIRYDPKNSLMPAKAPKVLIVKSGSQNKAK
jgi:hypothetical protein